MPDHPTSETKPVSGDHPADQGTYHTIEKDDFMIIKGSELSKDDEESLIARLEKIRDHLSAIERAAPALTAAGGPTAPVQHAIDRANNAIVEIRREISHIEQSVPFIPKELLDSLRPAAGAITTFSIQRATLVPGLKHLEKPGKDLISLIDSSLPKSQPSPSSSAIQQILSTINELCARLTATFAHAPAPTEPKTGASATQSPTAKKEEPTTTKPAGKPLLLPPGRFTPEIGNNAASIKEDVEAIRAFGDYLHQGILSQNPTACNRWIASVTGRLQTIEKHAERIAFLNERQNPRNLFFVIEQKTEQMARQVSAIPWPPGVSIEGLQEAARSLQRTVANSRPEHSIQPLDAVAQEIAASIDAIIKQLESSAKAAKAQAGQAEDAKKKVAAAAGRAAAAEQEVRDRLAGELAKIKADFLENLDPEAHTIQKIGQYLSYLQDVQNSHKTFEAEPAIKKVIPELLTLQEMEQKGLLPNAEQIHKDFEYSLLERLITSRRDTESRLTADADKEVREIKLLQIEIMRAYKRLKDQGGDAADRADTQFKPLINRLTMIRQGVEERSAKVKELTGLLKLIPKALPTKGPSSIKEIINRINAFESKKDHPKALQEAIQDLESYIALHRRVVDINTRLTPLMRQIEITEAEHQWMDPDAIRSVKDEFDRLLTA